VLTSAQDGWKSLWMETQQLTPLWMKQLIANVGFHRGQDTSPMLTRHTCHKNTGPSIYFTWKKWLKNDCDIKLHYCNMANSNFFPSKYGDLGHYLPQKKKFLWLKQHILLLPQSQNLPRKETLNVIS
jgi:hypothetical protein